MRMMMKRLAVLALLTMFGGCGEKQSPQTEENKTPAGQAAAAKGHDHSEWWCDEHGVPEAECSICSAKVADDLKKKGDWCKEHDRAKSQCFKCDPSLKDRYAAKYRAKFGKEPPAITDDSAKQTEKN